MAMGAIAEPLANPGPVGHNRGSVGLQAHE